MKHLLLGLDIGSSSVKASFINAETGLSEASAQSPAEEMPMLALETGWAEQDPTLWWQHMTESVKMCFRKAGARAEEVKAIGISYQMHGLVLVDARHQVLRPSIIWCDSRAVGIGQQAAEALGEQYCLEHFLNSPGNFTASKLKWVRDNEPGVFEKIHRIMLPGDYIAMRLSGEIVTTDTGLSEGIFWDYPGQKVSDKLLQYFGFDKKLLPSLVPVFGLQGKLRKEAAEMLGLHEGIPIAYRAGDQPNNAFSLNVLKPGETAATAGTSGVIYSVTGKNAYDPLSRVNTFIHVNNRSDTPSNGVLLCINGTGILNSWLRKNIRAAGTGYDYEQMNALAAEVPVGANGLSILPFGNGAERILQNKTVNASFLGLDFNHHTQAHLFRAAQEGIVFALKYGFEVLQEMGLQTSVIRAGHANMFLSPVFREAFVNTIGAPLELYNTDGATGAAIGAGLGAGIFDSTEDAFKGLKAIKMETPSKPLAEEYQAAYLKWKLQLNQII
jgi:xylulokinase